MTDTSAIGPQSLVDPLDRHNESPSAGPATTAPEHEPEVADA